MNDLIAVCETRGNRAAGLALSLGCFAAGIALFCPNPLPEPYPTVLRCAGLWLILTAVILTEKTLLTRYTYKIEKTGSGVDLVMTETLFRHTRTLCRIGVGEIEKVVLFEKSSREKGRKYYDYRPGISSGRTYAVLTSEDGAPVGVKFSPTDEFCDILTRLASLGKGNDHV